jgi:hypothetical protein
MKLTLKDLEITGFTAQNKIIIRHKYLKGKKCQIN